MLKIITNIAVFGTYLIVASFLAFVLWQSFFGTKESADQPDTSQAAHAEQQGVDKNAGRAGPPPTISKATDEAIASYTRWLAIFTALLVLATVALFYSGERNVDAANNSAKSAQDAAGAANASVKLAEETARRQLRAYVYLDSGEIRKIVNGDRTYIEVRQVFKNYGQTPAYKYRAWGGVLVLDAKNPVFPPMKEGIAETVVGPGQIRRAPIAGPVSDAELAAIKAKTKAIYVMGWIRYEDAFGRTWTHEMYETNGQEIMIDGSQGWQLVPAEKGYTEK
jgi:hypothetical protein